MEKQNLKRFAKFISFLLVALTVISVVILTANGKNADGLAPGTNGVDSSDGNRLPGGINTNQDAVPSVPQDKDNDTSQDGEVPEDKPLYFNKLTGLECTEDEYKSTAFGIVIDPLLHSYGLSYSDISFEFPTESGYTRMLFFSSSDDVLWKIGSLSPTRKFINAMSAYFGGVIIGGGVDDEISYGVSAEGLYIDISKHTDCVYKENGSAIYTNENLINIAFNRTQLSNSAHGYKNAPFVFASGEAFNGIAGANNIVIPYSKENATSLVFDESVKKYKYCKNGEEKVDMLNGVAIEYKNVFILFANSTTYENASATELVLDTDGGGVGYYFTDGRKTEFKWYRNESGEIKFVNLMGEMLEVNKGNSYISFCKASEMENLIIY